MKSGIDLKQCIRAWILAIVSISIILLGCEAKKPIMIGFIGGTSGRVADLGISGLDAVQLAVEQCNEHGGIGGRHVQLLIKNDQQNPDIARRVVQDLIKEGAIAIIGPMTSDMAVAVTPLLNSSQVLTVSPTATTQQLSGLDDFFFRVSATTRQYAARLAEYHIRTGQMGRVAAIYDLKNRSFTENWLENFKTPFIASGGEFSTTIGFRSDEGRSFSDLAQELLSSTPGGILIVANSMDSALLCQQIRKINSDIPITLADWGATERLLELGGKAVEGVTVVQTFNRESKVPRYREFRKIYMERYKREPGFPGVFAYDSTRVVLAALNKHQKDRNLKDTLLSIGRFEGLQGEIEFDEFGDVKRSFASVSIVRNRKFVVLE